METLPVERERLGPTDLKMIGMLGQTSVHKSLLCYGPRMRRASEYQV